MKLLSSNPSFCSKSAMTSALVTLLFMIRPSLTWTVSCLLHCGSRLFFLKHMSSHSASRKPSLLGFLPDAPTAPSLVSVVSSPSPSRPPNTGKYQDSLSDLFLSPSTLSLVISWSPKASDNSDIVTILRPLSAAGICALKPRLHAPTTSFSTSPLGSLRSTPSLAACLEQDSWPFPVTCLSPPCSYPSYWITPIFQFFRLTIVQSPLKLLFTQTPQPIHHNILEIYSPSSPGFFNNCFFILGHA